MTPKRKAYLAKCSNREIWLRSEIRNIEIDIHWQKYRLSNANEEWIATGARCELWHKKQLLMTLRHELARLKGMDRVVVVGDDEPFVNTLTGAEYWTCKCGTGIYVTDNYCSNCGKRILWRR